MITFYSEQQATYYDKNIKIIDTINEFLPYFKIPDDTKNLFINNPFTISHILSIFEYFELLCFKEFKKIFFPYTKR